MKRLLFAVVALLFLPASASAKEAPIWWAYASVPDRFGVPFDEEILTSIRDGWFVVNDEPILLKGVQYSRLPPDLLEGEARRTHEELQRDIPLIKAAGFNCVRLCEAAPEELELFRANGLLVLQQIWVDPETNFASSSAREFCAQRMIRIARQSRPYENVVGYLIMSDPAILDARSPMAVGKAEVFFRAMVQALREGDPKARAGIAEPPQLAHMNHSFYDFVAVNLPPASEVGTEARVVNEWLAQNLAGDRPFLGTAYGARGVTAVSQVPYGGLSQTEQRDRALDDLNALLNAEALGFFALDFKDDRWRMEIAQDVQDQEEGLIGIVDAERRPRAVYEALAEANWSVVTEPRERVSYTGAVPVNVYCEPGIERVVAVIDGGAEIELDHLSLHWWVTRLNVEDGYHDLPLSAGPHTLTIRAYDADGFCRAPTERRFVIAPEGGDPSDWTIALRAPQLAPWQGEIALRATLTDGLGNPVPNTAVRITCEFHGRAQAVRAFTGRTNAQGLFTLNIPLGSGYQGYATITASAEAPTPAGPRPVGTLAFVLIQ